MDLILLTSLSAMKKRGYQIILHPFSLSIFNNPKQILCIFCTDQLISFLNFRNYIKYAKQTYNPVLSDAAGQQLIQNYVEMRKIGSGRGQVTAYPRQLESLIRLAEAHARMRFSDTVEIVDVEEAARLHREALKQSATDPTTGRIDVSILTTGQG